MIIYHSSNNAMLSSNKILSIGAANYWEVLYTFQIKILFSINKGYVRSYHNSLFKNWRRQNFFLKRTNYTVRNSSHFLPWLSWHDPAMILQ